MTIVILGMWGHEGSSYKVENCMDFGEGQRSSGVTRGQKHENLVTSVQYLRKSNSDSHDT